MKRLLIGLGCLIATGCSPAYAGWSNTYVDYNTSTGSSIVGLEGGIGEAYGFAEQNLSDNSTFAKVTNHTQLTSEGISLYAQGQYFSERDYNQHQLYLGIGYLGYRTASFGIAPWIGYGVVHDDYASVGKPLAGFTGYLDAGSLGTVHTWNEVGLEESSLNGALGLTKDVTSKVYTSLTYRYMYNDAGFDGFNQELLFKVGYHL